MEAQMPQMMMSETAGTGRESRQHELRLYSEYISQAGEEDISNYLREYCEESRGILATPLRELQRFVSSEALLAPRHRLTRSACSESSGGPYGSSQSAERLIPQFINGIGGTSRLRMFQEKLFGGLRGDAICAAIAKIAACETADLADLQLVDIKDYSTGRALLHGHFVYRIEVMSSAIGTRSFFLKGISHADYGELNKFAGWENRPHIDLYDPFFQHIALKLKTSKHRAEYVSEAHDPCVSAMVLAEEVIGAHTSVLFETEKSAMLQSPHTSEAQSFLKSLASWHGLSDLFGKGDRKLKRSEEMRRDSNYILTADSAGIPAVEGIDHELLFATPECQAYAEERGYTELEFLALVPPAEREGALKIYRDFYLEVAARLRTPECFKELFMETVKEFGAQSVEAAYLVKSAMVDPQFEFQQQARAYLSTLEALQDSGAPLSYEERLSKLAALFGVRCYNRAAESGSALEWCKAGGALKINPALSAAASHTVYERMTTLVRVGLTPAGLLREDLDNFLSSTVAHGAGRKALNEEKLLVAIENPLQPGRSFRGKLSLAELFALGSAVKAVLPEIPWTVTAFPWREIRYQGNIQVSEDNSVHGEFVRGTKQPSRGHVDWGLMFNTPPFIGWFPKLSSQDAEFTKIVAQVMEALPKEEDGRFLPGYYEVAVGYRDESNCAELFFQDYWPRI